LARLVPVPYGRALRVVLALRADDLDDFLFQQLGQDAEADPDTQRQQPLLRRADQLPERLLHTLRQHDLVTRLGERYGALHGGSSLSIFRITRHAPKRSGREGGTADLRSSTSYGTTSVRSSSRGAAPGSASLSHLSALSRSVAECEKLDRRRNWP